MTSVLARTPIVDDTVSESAEDFTLTAAVSSGATTNANVLSTVTIEDNDAPSLSVADLTVTEGVDAFAEFTISLSAVSFEDITVDLALADGAAAGLGVDYGSAGAGNLEVSTDGGVTWTDASSATILAGMTSVLARTPIVDDLVSESAEDFVFTATVTTGLTSNPSSNSAVTIEDNDAPSLSIADLSVTEGVDAFAEFAIVLSVASFENISVDLALADGVAAGLGVDYGTNGAGNLEVSTDGGVTWTDATNATISAGVTSVLARTPIVDDSASEPSEDFTFTATVTSGLTANPSASSTVTIADNDAPSLSIDDLIVTEDADAFATFAIALSAVSFEDIAFDVALSDGTANGGGIDYGAGGDGNLEISTDNGANWTDAESATITAGSSSVLFRTPVIDDSNSEPTEHFTLTATITSGLTQNSSAMSTATINDDDAPSLSIANVTVTEGTDSYALFTLAFSAPSFEDIAMELQLADLTATGAGTDYGAVGSGNLEVSTDAGVNWTDVANATLTAGATSVLARTPITDDALSEPAEEFTLTATITSGATANSMAMSTVSIQDNDSPSVSIGDVVVVEGADAYAEFVIALSNPSFEDISMNLSLVDDTATGGAVDYGTTGVGNLEVSTDAGANWTDAVNVTVVAGSTSVLARTPIVDDGVGEGSEAFTLVASITGGMTQNASATGTGQIEDPAPLPARDGDSPDERKTRNLIDEIFAQW